MMPALSILTARGNAAPSKERGALSVNIGVYLGHQRDDLLAVWIAAFCTPAVLPSYSAVLDNLKRTKGSIKIFFKIFFGWCLCHGSAGSPLSCTTGRSV
jgi:hypothetical protein